MDDTFDLAAKLASRICHDLISPVGAISNGVELLGLAGLEDSPELALVGDSVRHAEGRIKFFRVAFGRADPGQQVSEAEIRTTLEAYLGGGRVRLDWPDPGTVARQELRAVFLAINCLETELAFGGEIAVRGAAGGWEVSARAERMRGAEEAWAALEDADAAAVGPEMLQFALLPMAVAALGREVSVVRGDGEIAVRV